MTQKAVLFAGDIRENVLFGESRAGQTDENVKNAIELAQASEFMEKLPEDRGADYPGGVTCPADEATAPCPWRWENRRS